jgi:hypothetical protein
VLSDPIRKARERPLPSVTIIDAADNSHRRSPPAASHENHEEQKKHGSQEPLPPVLSVWRLSSVQATASKKALFLDDKTFHQCDPYSLLLFEVPLSLFEFPLVCCCFHFLFALAVV